MLKPLHDYLLIDPFVPPKVLNGIVIQSQQLGKPVLGRVLAIGPGKVGADGELKSVSPELTVGCVVGFNSGSLVGKLWRDDAGKQHPAFMLQAEHVLGIEAS